MKTFTIFSYSLGFMKRRSVERMSRFIYTINKLDFTFYTVLELRGDGVPLLFRKIFMRALSKYILINKAFK